VEEGQRLSQAATDRTVHVISDLNHLTAEHCARISVKSVKSRRGLISEALNVTDTRDFDQAPLGTDLFRGQWSQLQAKEQERQKQDKEAAKASSSGRQGKKHLWKGKSKQQQPFPADRDRRDPSPESKRTKPSQQRQRAQGKGDQGADPARRVEQ
jgi:hypothetical protein